MAADVNDIIAQGFGSWSSVNSIPTLGFGIGAAPAAGDSIYYEILSQVQDTIQALNLTSISDDNIKLAKVENFRETVFPDIPGIMILPLGSENISISAGTNCRDDIGYPVGILIIDSERQDTSTGAPAGASDGTQDQEFRFDAKILWRESVRKAFINQRLDLAGTHPDVHRCTIEPMDIVRPDDWLRANLWISGMIVRCWVRETRG